LTNPTNTLKPAAAAPPAATDAAVPPERFDVVVIGAGQAGMAIGYFLARQGRRFVILEAAGAVGAAWRGRWNSLVLFTPRRYDALPGLGFPGDAGGYPTRDEVIAYLDQYAATFDLPIEFNSAVRSLTQENGAFRLEVDGRQIAADQVVVATGPFQRPRVPPAADQLAAEVFQTHSADYRRPSDVPDGRVLVVGGGNTGFQIAEELSATREVHLSIGSRQTPLPQRIFGRDLFWYLEKTNLIRKSTDTRMGRRLAGRDNTLIGSSPRALRKRHGVRLHPRAVEASGRTIRFTDGTALDVGAVIWATGFRNDHSWIGAPIFDHHGRLVHRRGVTDSPGLYFLGLAWQHSRGSALIGWIGEDAAYVADQIKTVHTGRPKLAAGEAVGAR